MAIIQYTAIVNQIRGKLNGSQFNKGRTSYTLQRKSSQNKNINLKQWQARGNFSFVQRGWKNLSTSVKQDWAQVAINNPDINRFGEQVVLSGYNKYIQSALRALSGEFPLPVPPATGSAPAYQFNLLSVDNVSFNPAPGGETAITADFQIYSNQASSDIAVVVYISYPYSPGVTAYYNTHIKLWAGTPTTMYNLGLVNFSIGKYPAPQPGQMIEFKFEVFWKQNGVRVQEDTLQYKL